MDGMRELKNYTFEVCWLVLVLMLYATAPVRTSADTFSYEEAASDCPEISGWCVEFLM
jgi:hypothetical protein